MTRVFFNQKAAAWDEQHCEQDIAKLKVLSQRLGIEPGTTLLDVGSGTGIFLPFLLKKLGKQGVLVALDYAEEMLRKARGKNFSQRIGYLQGNVASLPLRSEIFDACVCYSSFPHFQNKPKALVEMNRVLKEGGWLFICHTSSRSEINQVHCQIPALVNDIIPVESEMKSLLERAQFINISIADDASSYLAIAQKKPQL
ncbi:MAG TPA: class I SAM-dependent methyltransferase [Dehalococcoidia bacterium]|nr:class I SAM-dependent methyltransferase [Dehalococcoidia bacterium]